MLFHIFLRRVIILLEMPFDKFEPTPGGAREILKFTTAVHSTDFSPLHNCLVFAVTDGGKLHLRIVSSIKLSF